jgi:hypothetical protein
MGFRWDGGLRLNLGIGLGGEVGATFSETSPAPGGPMTWKGASSCATASRSISLVPPRVVVATVVARDSAGISYTFGPFNPFGRK